uniref:Uncharacterized protein n=1 Tax=Chenopodium quinoa TaxID=63459 RepID=A0A803LW11_CHEQI
MAVVVKATSDSSDSSTSLNVFESVQNLVFVFFHKHSAMDSSVATDLNNAKDYTDVHLERIIRNSIEKESAANAGSSGAATVDASSCGAATDACSSGAAAEACSSGAAAEAGSSGAAAEASSSGAAAEAGCHLHLSLMFFKEFSKDQLIVIRAIGFGSLEFLKVSQLPLQLGFWLVKHFDAHSCMLNIPDSDPFKITEQHVHEILGLSAGGIKMDANVFSKDDNVINQ